jgi:DNA-binding IclR family transcriptional regulator
MRIEDVLQRIQGEYVEMPGLRLTPAQAQRLWGLDRATCERLLTALVNENFLSQTRDGSFVRTDSGPRRVPRSAA